MSLQDHIEKVLDSIVNPTHDAGLIASKNVQGLHVDDDGKVAFVLEFPSTQVELGTKIREEAIHKIEAIPGVAAVNVVLTTDKKPRPKGQARDKTVLPGVQHILLVGSGKGGVGKSTTALNLSCALLQQGLQVGILDADVYGPSLPRMLGVNKRPISEDGKMMEPIRHHGLQCMSVGFMLADSAPAIWRGPMVNSAIQQMMRQTLWDNLDVLVVDLPPGTGDIPISLIQHFYISGAVVVSTPQDIALLDARKAVNMFTRMETSVLGFVENMSYFQCPHCNERTDIFHHGGARKDAAELGIPFLGEIPLNADIRMACDAGVPLIVAQPDSALVEPYKALAEQVWGNLTSPSVGVVA